MTYQEYFKQANFEDIWFVLFYYYKEDELIKPYYKNLIKAIKKIKVKPKYSSEIIKVYANEHVDVEGAPDPQEWLVGREVEIECFRSNVEYWDKRVIERRKLYISSDTVLGQYNETAGIAAHLIFWSTLYSFKTHTQHVRDFIQYFKDMQSGVIKPITRQPDFISESHYKKQVKFWRDSVAYDTAIDWTSNLNILQKKLEYNIGYWRYVQRHVGWEEDVKRMQTACRLMEITGSDYHNIDGKYINTSNAFRYTKATDRNPSDKDCHKHYLKELYRDKTYHILWKFLDHNMKKWWD